MKGDDSLNIVRELRKKKGIQQKELAIAIGVSCPTVSGWESGKKDPSGERLKKLAEYFDVDELFILGYGLEHAIELDKAKAIPQTEQIVQYVLDRLNNTTPEYPKTEEAKILASGIDKMPKEQREQALNIMKAVFSQYAGYFEEKNA